MKPSSSTIGRVKAIGPVERKYWSNSFKLFEGEGVTKLAYMMDNFVMGLAEEYLPARISNIHLITDVVCGC